MTQTVGRRRTQQTQKSLFLQDPCLPRRWLWEESLPLSFVLSFAGLGGVHAALMAALEVWLEEDAVAPAVSEEEQKISQDATPDKHAEEGETSPSRWAVSLGCLQIHHQRLQ